MIIAWWSRRQYYHHDGDRTPTLGLRAYILLFLSFFIYATNAEMEAGGVTPHRLLRPIEGAAVQARHSSAQVMWWLSPRNPRLSLGKVLVW